MSRPVQIGDYAYIIFGDQEYPLLITDIKPSYIIADDYTLIPVDNHWMVQDYSVEHSVDFRTGSLSAYVPEITSQILLSLDYEDLINACQTNKDFNKVCQDEYFWKLKVEHDYGMLTQDKPLNITYRQQYIDLMTIEDLKFAVLTGRLDLLKWLAKRGIYPDQRNANGAAYRGQLEVLKWLAQIRGVYPDQDGTNKAASMGRLEVLKWLAQTRDLYPDQHGISNAVLKGKLEVLKWLVQVRKFYPDQWNAGRAASRGQLEFLDWLAQLNIYPDRRTVNDAALHNKSEVVEWLAEHNIYPDQPTVDLLALVGLSEILQLLAQYNIHPN
jgi:hypothetical protein